MNPPKEMLDSIGSDVVCFIAKQLTFTKCDESIQTFFDFMRDILIKLFGKKDRPYAALQIFIDLFRNAVEHGNQWDPTKNIVTGLWAGDKGVCFGVLDENKLVTDMIGRREPITTTRREEDIDRDLWEVGGGAGLGICYYLASDIQIVNGAIFFTMLLADNIKNS